MSTIKYAPILIICIRMISYRKRNTVIYLICICYRISSQQDGYRELAMNFNIFSFLLEPSNQEDHHQILYSFKPCIFSRGFDNDIWPEAFIFGIRYIIIFLSYHHFSLFFFQFSL